MRIPRPLPPQRRLRNLFDYDPLTGKLTWKVPMSARQKAGDEAGTDQNGYRMVTICKQRFYSHRLIWRWWHGEDPGVKRVDHRDTDTTNNRICNLRKCTHRQNSWNSKTPKANTSGYKGVREHRPGKWVAHMRKNGKTNYLGTFASAEEAAKCYANAAKKCRKEFARVA